MRIKMRVLFCGSDGTHQAGSVLEVLEHVGKQLVERGYAELVDVQLGLDLGHGEPEAAALEAPPEQATVPAARKKK